MMMTSSPFGLDDTEALLWGPSSPMADPIDALLLHTDKEQHKRGGTSISGGCTSPVMSLSSLPSSSSPQPFYSPPPSPPAPLLHGDKAGTESDLLPWLPDHDQLGCSETSADISKGDVFFDFGWMTERVDLTEFDLDFLTGSCSPDQESSSSPEDLFDSLNGSMMLDSLSLPTLTTPTQSSVPTPSPSVSCTSAVSTPSLSTSSTDLAFIPSVEPVSSDNHQQVLSPSPCVPEPQEELEIKSEPVSPTPLSMLPPLVHSPRSPAYTLDLGSEVDVPECEVKPVVATILPQAPRIVLSLSPTRIVLLLAPKDEVGVATTTITTTPDIHSSPSVSSLKATRKRPYPDPKSRASPTITCVKSRSSRCSRGGGGAEKAALKAPKDKKLKKMEQNKTAATRYRQKKRAEQESLSVDYAELKRRNIELTEKADSMAREIQYLKELMEEVQLAKIKKGLDADLPCLGQRRCDG
ncbi:activating transcription factor 4b [Lampris incognitus]|uniref:activating transcription factor 4b n=1 Tax=Lampris incognitus TaxID=2546036 RepID=UPI0024B52EB8|nr:activating transcription factor 4b [Lampris incognitus]